MSVSNIPFKVRQKLWGCAAGRCEYCNKPLWEDIVTKTQVSTAYIAHIVAEEPCGPRGDDVLSEKLKHDFSNLMLLCDTHHRLIDKEDVAGHSVERLREIKRKHEDRILIQTELSSDQQSHILHYAANIGRLNAVVTWEQSKEAMFPSHYPAESRAIEINIKNSAFRDSETDYWNIERQNLQRHFESKVQQRLGEDIHHLSVFAIAPQPLLVELGRLLSDVSAISVYQHQKEPEDNWMWSEEPLPINYQVTRPDKKTDVVALNLSLSATIDNTRITSVLGDDVSIWTVTIDKPNNDFLKSRTQLQAFRERFRKLLDEIKLEHGQHQIIHVFPAVPVSSAIEIGRVWMPKADLPLMLYDQNYKLGGFAEAFTIDSDQL